MGNYRFLEKDKTRALARNRGDYKGTLSLSEKDLNWWILNLPRAQRRIWVSVPEMEMIIDACDYGWGVVFNLPGGEKMKTNGLWSALEKGWHINIKETMAVWLGLSKLDQEGP